MMFLLGDFDFTNSILKDTKEGVSVAYDDNEFQTGIEPNNKHTILN